MRIIISIGLVIFSAFAITVSAQKNHKPINENASRNARLLLNFLYEIKEKYILSGHHNYAHNLNQYSDRATAITGKVPALWGADFIPTEPELRQNIVDEAIEKYKNGYVVTLMWHAGRPQDDPPYGWKESVQAEVSEQEWKDIITPGTDLHNEWLKDVDQIAVYLNQLKEAGVPVLWRPYHEMNGIWFWWGDKPGEEGFKKLWINLYERFTEHHQLNNLIWVWNANGPRDRINDEAYPYQDFFPGLDYVDVLATDVYHNDYKKTHHDHLLDLAEGKPIALGEIGEVPVTDRLVEQPEWVWFMIWSKWIDTHNTVERVQDLYNYSRTITKDELKFKNGKYEIKETAN